MLTIASILVTTALLSLTMLLMLGSLLRTGINGVREWFIANICLVLALPLFILRGAIPDLFSIVVANILLVMSCSCYYAGCALFLGRPAHWRRLAAAITTLTGVIVIWTYVGENFPMRVLVISTFNAIIFAATAVLLLRHRPLNRHPHPYWFAAAVAMLFAICQVLRGAYFSLFATADNLMNSDTIWNVALLSIGAVAVPTMTMAAIMMVHDAMLASVEDAANHDHMTGALSRKWLETIAREQIMRAQRTGKPLSLLIIDLDHFKHINDTHGHAVGDEVLREFAHITIASLRDGDALGRLGGEEFGVLLPNTDTEVAIKIANRLREQSQQHVISGSFGVCNYSISIGVATARSGENFDLLSARADRALYLAKNNGRNRVEAEPNGTGKEVLQEVLVGGV